MENIIEKLTDEEILSSKPSDLSDVDFERYNALIEEIRKVPHKVVNGIPVALTQDEIKDFEKKEENYDEIMMQNKKNTLILQRTKFLDETDRKMYKALDVGSPDYPEKASRAKAREEIAAIKASESESDLEKFSSTFEPLN